MSDSRDVIQTRLLSNISDEYNKTEGEFFYDALKPVAIELEGTYTTIEGLPDKRFADTATGKNLDRIVKEKGLTRKVTTRSTGIVTITGTYGANITSGELVASDTLQFEFLDTTTIPIGGTINVTVRCKTYGTVGNVPIGAIKNFPKTLAGLTGVTNSSAFTNGTDEETDESLRERYYIKVEALETTANKAAFKTWALSVNGTGAAKILPLWNGNGTVKVLITNSQMKAADSTLISAVQNYIDPNLNGDGSGIMPLCGAVCTVESASEKIIDISATIQTTLDSEVAKSEIETVISEYFKSIAFQQNYVSYAVIGNKILNINGINDYTNLTINSGTNNVTLLNTEVPVLGTVVVTVG